MTIRPNILQFRRAELENHIEDLIALLDLIDGDENLEPELAGWDSRQMDDREGDDEREWDPAEDGIADVEGLQEQAPGFCLGHGVE
jgi:hypothetical protein